MTPEEYDRHYQRSSELRKALTEFYKKEQEKAEEVARRTYEAAILAGYERQMNE